MANTTSNFAQLETEELLFAERARAFAELSSSEAINYLGGKEYYNQVVGEIFTGQEGLYSEEVINLLKKNLPVRGNPVNYLAGVLSADLKVGLDSYLPDVLHSASAEVRQNIFTSLSEHLRAKTECNFSYNLDWRLDEQGNKEAYGIYGSMRKVFTNAVYDQTGQVPEFEKERNANNLKFYEKLEAAANTDKVLVEFSPSPELTQDSVERGYQGDDALFVYKRSADGQQEEVTQHWFKGSGVGDYEDLVTELIALADGQNEQQLTELNTLAVKFAEGKATPGEIMKISGVFNDSQLSSIMAFAERGKAKQPILEPTQKELLSKYLETNMQGAVDKKLMPKLFEIATHVRKNLSAGAKELGTGFVQEVQMALSNLMNLLDATQLQYLYFARDVVGVPQVLLEQLLPAEKYPSAGTDYKQFSSAGMEEQLQMVADTGYQMVGCGIGRSANSTDGGSNAGSFGYWGKFGRVDPAQYSIQLMGMLTNPRLKDYAEKYVFVCSFCETMHSIDTEKGIFVEKCSHCGADARC